LHPRRTFLSTISGIFILLYLAVFFIAFTLWDFPTFWQPNGFHNWVIITYFLAYIVLAFALFIAAKGPIIVASIGLCVWYIYYAFPVFARLQEWIDYEYDYPIHVYLCAAVPLLIAFVAIAGVLFEKPHFLLKLSCLIPLIILLVCDKTVHIEFLYWLDCYRYKSIFEPWRGLPSAELVESVWTVACFVRTLGLCGLTFWATDISGIISSPSFSSARQKSETLEDLVDVWLSRLYDANKPRLASMIWTGDGQSSQKNALSRDWLTEFEMYFHISRRTRKEQKFMYTIGDPVYTSDLNAYKDSLLRLYKNPNTEKITRHAVVDVRLVSDRQDFVTKECLKGTMTLELVKEGDCWKVKNMEMGN